MRLKDWLQPLFDRIRLREPVSTQPGMIHNLRETESGITRFHLRVERDGSGLLIANATALTRLSPSGVIIAKALLEGQKESDILKDLKATFRDASPEIMSAGIACVKQLLQQLTAPGDTYPVFNLDDAAVSPDAAELIAPLQAALPLAPHDKLRPLLERLWEVGIPHVTIFANPGFSSTDLIRAVERAEDLGMITGVRARASDLLTEGLLDDLLVAGIDHVTFPYAMLSSNHDALLGDGDHAAADGVLDWLEENAVCAAVEIPLIESTLADLEDTIRSLLDRGADNFSFVAYVTADPALVGQQDGALDADAMPQIAAIVEDIAHEVQARFVWEPPVERDPTQRLADQVLKGPRCAGDVAVRIETDGSVIAPRGPYRSAGNLLQDKWETIWNDDDFRRYRERVESPTRCGICPGLVICAADCPRNRKGWAQKP